MVRVDRRNFQNYRDDTPRNSSRLVDERQRGIEVEREERRREDEAGAEAEEEKHFVARNNSSFGVA